MRAIVAAGVLMGLAGLMRFQFAPAIALYAAMVAGRDLRLWKGLLAGGLPVVALGAGIDVAMGLTPYEWILTNYRMNIGEGRMREIGGISHSHYLFATIHFWQWAALIIPVLVALAWKQHKALIVMAIANIAVHQLIGHKEYRYLWLSMQTLLLVAALGSVNALRLTVGGRRLANPDGLKPTSVADRRVGRRPPCCLRPAPSIGSIGGTAETRRGWRRAAMRDPAVCGLGVPRREYTLFGYATLHRPKPIFLIPEEGPVSLANPGRVGERFQRDAVWAGSAAAGRIPGESRVPGRAARPDLPVPAAGRLHRSIRRTGPISIRKRCFGWTARRRRVIPLWALARWWAWVIATASASAASGPAIRRRAAGAGPWHGPAPFRRRRCRPPPS